MQVHVGLLGLQTNSGLELCHTNPNLNLIYLQEISGAAVDAQLPQEVQAQELRRRMLLRGPPPFLIPASENARIARRCAEAKGTFYRLAGMYMAFEIKLLTPLKPYLEFGALIWLRTLFVWSYGRANPEAFAIGYSFLWPNESGLPLGDLWQDS